MPVPTEAPSRVQLLERGSRIASLVVANGVATYFVLGYLPLTLPSGILLLVLTLASFAVAYRWRLHRDRVFLATWLGVSVAAAVTSLLTGALNGLTDEPFIMPVLAGLWPNLYGSSVSFVYSQYGTSYAVSGLYDVYLPFLAFAQVPGIDYKWTTLGCWVGSLYLLRRRGSMLTLWGGPWVGLMAANGFNDFVPLLALTLTFVTLTGASSKVAEFVSLGLKQFANVVVVAVHLYHRRWRDALVAVVVTAAILAPFAFLSPGGVWCHAMLIEPNTCHGGAGSAYGVGVFNHVNYPLWPLWAVAVFGPGYVRSLYRDARGGARGKFANLVRTISGSEAGSIPGSAR